MKGFVLVLGLLWGCAAEPVGVVRLALGTAAVPEGVDRMTLTLAAPDIGTKEVPLDPAAATFETVVPAGAGRTLTFLAEHEDVPWYWGTTTFSIGEGEVIDVVVPAVPAAELVPSVHLAGVPVPAAIVTATLESPLADLPDRFEDATDAEGRADRVLPAGRYRIDATAVLDGAPHGLGADGIVVELAQGEVVEVPLSLAPAAEGVVDRLEIELGALRVGDAADLVVRAVDATGALVPDFSGRILFSSSAPEAVALPEPYTFVPDADRGEHRFAGGLSGLAVALSVTISVAVEGSPAIGASRAIDVLDSGDLAGAAARLVLALDGPLSGGLLADPVGLTVSAVDEAGRIATGYRGTITFADSDLALLGVPPDVRFEESNAGVVRIARAIVALVPAGTALLRAHDVDDASLSGELSIPIE